MTPATILRTLGVLAVALAIAVIGAAIRSHAVRSATGRIVAATATDAAAALRDTTRELHDPAVLAALHDTLRVFQRRALQAARQADSLDRALGQATAARTAAVVRVRELSATLERRTAADTVAEFTLRDAPYTVAARVRLPRGANDAQMTAHVILDTLPLAARVGCGPARESALRPASVTVTGPPWATITLDHVEVDPQVCTGNPSFRDDAGADRSWLRGMARRVHVGAGYGVVAGGRDGVAAGIGVWAGVALWP
jgi:hypothetical protein